MDSKDATFGTPRSGTSFALALALALFTFWGAGLVFELHSFVVDAPILHAAASPTTPACAPQAAEGASCGVATRP